MSERHVIHHRGSPRADPEPDDFTGCLYIIGFILVGGLVLAIVNFIAEVISKYFALIIFAGLVAIGIWVYLKWRNTENGRLKIKRRELRKLSTMIQESRQRESKAQDATKTLSDADRDLAVSEAIRETKGLSATYDSTNSEIISILGARKTRLKEKRNAYIKEARNNKSADRFLDDIEKIEAQIQTIDEDIRELVGQRSSIFE